MGCIQMKFDLLLLGRYPPDELLSIAQIAEHEGYGYFWYADEKFFRDPYIGLSYVALNTERIKVGPCVTDPYTRHPAITAMAAATLAELVPGRLNLGIGAGYSGLPALGIKQSKPLNTLREAILLMRQLWTGEWTTFEGQQVSFSNGRLEFVPPQQHIPITIAATGRRMLSLAGEIADGIMIGDYASPRTIGEAMRQIRSGAHSADRELKSTPITARVNLSINEDRNVALEALKRSIALSLWIRHPKWDYYLDYSPEWEERFQSFKRFIEDHGGRPKNVGEYGLVEPYVNLITDEMVKNRHLAGTIKDIAEQIGDMQNSGVNRVTVYPVAFGDQSLGEMIRVFAREVMPIVNAGASD